MKEYAALDIISGDLLEFETEEPSVNPTQLVIFDLDGTLFDPTNVIIKALYQAIDSTEKQFGIDIKYPNRAEILKLVGEADSKFIEGLELD